MYHRFGNADKVATHFNSQCAYIAKSYSVISLGEVASALRGERSLPDNATVITVDDGYRDFFDVAYPILREYRLAATVFLVTDFVDGKEWLWTDKLRYCIQRTRLPRVEITIPTGETIRFELNNEEQRSKAASVLNQVTKKLPDKARRGMIGQLPELLETELPKTAPSEYAPLTWKMIRRMSRDGFEFGAHTENHPILSRIESEVDLRQQIVRSKIRVEEEIGMPVSHFSYPNGGFDERSLNVVRRAGFQSAVTVQCGLNPLNSDPFLLKRIGVEPDISEAKFQHWISGSVRGTIRRQ